MSNDLFYIIPGLFFVLLATIELKYGWHGKPSVLYRFQPRVLPSAKVTFYCELDDILNITGKTTDRLILKVDKNLKTIFFRSKYPIPILGAGPFIGTMRLTDNGNNIVEATFVAKTIFTLSIGIVILLVGYFITGWNMRMSIVENITHYFLYMYKSLFVFVAYCFIERATFRNNVNLMTKYINETIEGGADGQSGVLEIKENERRMLRVFTIAIPVILIASLIAFITIKANSEMIQFAWVGSVFTMIIGMLIVATICKNDVR